MSSGTSTTSRQQGDNFTAAAQEAPPPMGKGKEARPGAGGGDKQYNRDNHGGSASRALRVRAPTTALK